MSNGGASWKCPIRRSITLSSDLSCSGSLVLHMVKPSRYISCPERVFFVLRPRRAGRQTSGSAVVLPVSIPDREATTDVQYTRNQHGPDNLEQLERPLGALQSGLLARQLVLRIMKKISISQGPSLPSGSTAATESKKHPLTRSVTALSDFGTCVIVFEMTTYSAKASANKTQTTANVATEHATPLNVLDCALEYYKLYGSP